MLQCYCLSVLQTKIHRVRHFGSSCELTCYCWSQKCTAA